MGWRWRSPGGLSIQQGWSYAGGLGAALAGLCAVFGAAPAHAQSGFHGAPYVIVGTAGSSAWENYRKHVDSSGLSYAPVQAAWANDVLTYSGVCQEFLGPGLNDGIFLAPGLFLLRQVALATPRWTGPTLLTSTSPGFDVRVGFAEADDAQGHLTTLLANAGGDRGNQADLFFAGIANMLYVHFFVTPTGATRTYTLNSVSCGAAGSALDESNQTNHTGDVSGAASQSVAEGLPLSWSLVQAGKNADLTVFAGGTELWRWTVAAPSYSLLTTCDNPDGVNYSNGSLDLTRLVPVMFVGSSNIPASTPASLSLGFAGYGPHLEPIAQPVAPGADVSVQISVRDGKGGTLVDPGVSVVVTASGGGGPDGGMVVTPGLQPGGVSTVHFAFPQEGTPTVQAALQEAPLVLVQSQVAVVALPGADAGPDAGAAPPDAAAPGLDAAPEPPDAAAPDPDAAAAPPDADAPGLDAAPAPPDAALPEPLDADLVASDAQTPPGLDAQGPMPDAALPPGPDAAAVPHAGHLAFEAGCGCSASASSAWLGWAVVTALAPTRRRRARG